MTVLYGNLPTSRPPTIAESRKGEVFIATGLGRPQRWDGYSNTTEDAGISAPETSCSIEATGGAGSIQGVYSAYVRFLDDSNIPSSFSPVAEIDQSDSGVAKLYYSGIPTSSESRVTQRQIWRNTDGQGVTYYLDVTLDDNVATTAYTSNTDAQLRENESLRFTTTKGYPNANRFTVPPSHMAVVQFYQNRSWWLVPDEYSEGTVTISGTAVVGSGTNWTSHMVGLVFHTPSGQATISSVDSVTAMVLESTGAGSGTPPNYAIKPTATEYDAIYFSEDDEPESVPATNKLYGYPDGDRLVGAMTAYGQMFLLKSRHIYRLTTCSDPRTDTSITLVAERGCVNQRCWCRVEGLAFLVDELGAYFFDGNQIQSVSDPIQDYWRDTINWAAKQWFHVVHDPQNQCVRFYYAKDSDSRIVLRSITGSSSGTRNHSGRTCGRVALESSTTNNGYWPEWREPRT